VHVEQLHGSGVGLGDGVGTGVAVGLGVGFGVAVGGGVGRVVDVGEGCRVGVTVGATVLGAAVVGCGVSVTVGDSPGGADGADAVASGGVERDGGAVADDDPCDVSTLVALGEGSGAAMPLTKSAPATPAATAPLPASEPSRPSSVKRRLRAGICPIQAPNPMVRHRRPTEMLRNARTI
jgi:hypothetical protein